MEILFTRQPIFDRSQNVFAYDLLFKSSFANLYQNPDWEKANRATLALDILSSYLRMISRGKRALVTFSDNMLLQDMVHMFPPDAIAVELQQNGAEEEKIIRVCKEIRQRGYPLVLNCTKAETIAKALIDSCDIVKVDSSKQNDHIKRLLTENGHKKPKLLTINIHSREDFNKAIEQGSAYVQGDFYAKPKHGISHELKFSNINHLLLLQEINRPDISFDRLEKIIKRDVSLSYKLLRYINSAYFGFPGEIRSIKYALALLGLLNIRKWLSKVTMQDLGEDKPAELVLNSIIRARFCELLAPMIGLAERASELFLMGLFSMLDAFLDKPIELILSELPIHDDIKYALTGQACPFLTVYNLMRSYESGQWQDVSEYAKQANLQDSDLPLLFLKSLEWSDQLFSD
jgi:EAL and modified HD-GYP domain-containing signal transduction protein